MNFLKQVWVKRVLQIIAWLVFIWGIFIITAIISDEGHSVLGDWAFYLFGVLPIFAVIFIRHHIKKLILGIWSAMPSRNWLSKNWFKLAGILLIIFIVAQYFNYLDRKQGEEEEQTKREYTAKRKRDCLDVYQEEQKNWNNTQSYEYDEKEDVCRITYKATNEWKGVKCEEISPIKLGVKFDSPFWDSAWRRYSNCSEGIFDKEF